MEKHCVSLEIAKHLKEAGWKKETFFVWGEVEYGKKNLKDWQLLSKDNDEQRPITLQELLAPLATEILEELPDAQIIKYWEVYTNDKEHSDPMYDFIDIMRSPNELAKCWLYLKKEKLI